MILNTWDKKRKCRTVNPSDENVITLNIIVRTNSRCAVKPLKRFSELETLTDYE